MPSEFQLINQYFKQRGSHQGVMLGIGDDAALLNVPQGEVYSLRPPIPLFRGDIFLKIHTLLPLVIKP
jgi:hypothetical protein